MWEVALLIVAIAFAVAVVFAIPALLQVRDAAKELEFTLRETREAIRRLRELSEKTEAVIDQGRQVVDGAQRAFGAIDALLDRSSARFVSRVAATALRFLPVAVAATKFFNRYRRRKKHV